MIGQPGWRLQTVSQRQPAQGGSARVLRLLTGQQGLGLAPVLGGASGVDLADLFQGAGERVEVGGVLMASLPQAEDGGRRTPLLRKVAQVPGRSTEGRSADQLILGSPLACERAEGRSRRVPGWRRRRSILFCRQLYALRLNDI